MQELIRSDVDHTFTDSGLEPLFSFFFSMFNVGGTSLTY